MLVLDDGQTCVSYYNFFFFQRSVNSIIFGVQQYQAALLSTLRDTKNSIEKNEYVQFVLDLIEIVQIIFAPVLSVQSVLRLKQMIQQHLKQFKQLFPGE